MALYLIGRDGFGFGVGVAGAGVDAVAGVVLAGVLWTGLRQQLVDALSDRHAQEHMMLSHL